MYCHWQVCGKDFSSILRGKNKYNSKVELRTSWHRIYTSTELSFATPLLTSYLMCPFSTSPQLFLSVWVSVCLSVDPSICLHIMWTSWVQSVPGFLGSSLALGCLSNTGSLCWAAAHWTSQGPHIHKGMFGWIRYTATHTASLPVWLHKRNLTSKLGQGGSCCTLSPDRGRRFIQRALPLFWSCTGHWNNQEQYVFVSRWQGVWRKGTD